MRYMTGGSLSERLLKGGLSLEAATAVLSRIASALDRAHGMGIIHRDLKPDNILFDQYGDAYLADFGIAKIAEVTAALTGSGLIGTPAYMSPEQVKGETIDGRSDIYSLGIILYEMLSGKQPYEATTPWGVLSKHVNEPMPSILSKTATLPPQLDTIMTRATAKDVNDRFQTATELATAVTRITWQRPSTPTPTPTPPQPEADEPALLETIQVAVTELLSEPELLGEDIESSETSATSPPMVETEKVAEVVPATAEPEAKPAISFVAEELRPPVPKTAVPRTPKEMIASWPTWVWGVMIIALLLGVILAARGNEEETADTLAATPSAEDVPAGNDISGFILTKWKEYFRVTDLAHGRDGWVVFMSQNSPYGRQTWRPLNEFPTDFRPSVRINDPV